MNKGTIESSNTPLVAYLISKHRSTIKGVSCQGNRVTFIIEGPANINALSSEFIMGKDQCSIRSFLAALDHLKDIIRTSLKKSPGTFKKEEYPNE